MKHGRKTIKIGLQYEEDHPRRDGYVYVPRATGKLGLEGLDK